MAARGKADEAANAAVLAADGAKQAKDLVMNIPKVEKGGDSMLNLSKLRNLQVDNGRIGCVRIVHEMMKTEVSMLRKENTKQQN
eukprot:scaffold4383_cov126-Chaetoceros_neogracile.AAC.1